uniref:Uncharacterized protein n=1 Tax=Sphaerodactylus townsendi TaxID=933632 RepID=A0ACB8F083_9SAUR
MGGALPSPGAHQQKVLPGPARLHHCESLPPAPPPFLKVCFAVLSPMLELLLHPSSLLTPPRLTQLFHGNKQVHYKTMSEDFRTRITQQRPSSSPKQLLCVHQQFDFPPTCDHQL